MMAATEITEVTPITMPRIVSPLRTLRARRVFSATSRFSLNSARVILIGSQCGYRVELRGLGRRIDSEEKSDHRAEYDAKDRHPCLHGCRELGPGAQR